MSCRPRKVHPVASLHLKSCTAGTRKRPLSLFCSHFKQCTSILHYISIIFTISNRSYSDYFLCPYCCKSCNKQYCLDYRLRNHQTQHVLQSDRGQGSLQSDLGILLRKKKHHILVQAFTWPSLTLTFALSFSHLHLSSPSFAFHPLYGQSRR